MSKGPDLELEYASAYSLWPGHAHFRGLSLAAQDHNIQFAIHIDQGEVDVSLHELPLRRFRALRLRAEGLSFRFRHKVHEVGDNAARIAAYPPIGDFPDPPLYTGPEPAPVTDDDYDLWEIAIDEVDARVSELWFFEHRYAGSGVVRGGFHLRPARWFEVYPATVRLEGGALTFGAKTVAAQLALDIEARIQRTDVTQQKGLAILKSLSAKAALDSGDVDTSVADAYLPQGSRALGWSRVTAVASVSSGVLAPESRLELTACPLRLTKAGAALEGGLRSEVRITEPGRVVAEISSPALALSQPELGRGVGAIVEPRLEVDFSIEDVTQALRLERAEATLPELRVPSLALLLDLISGGSLRLGLEGRLDADARLSWGRQRALEGQAGVRLVGGRAELGEVRATFGARAEMQLRPSSEPAEPNSSRGTVSVDLDRVTLSERERSSAPFRVGVSTRSLAFTLSAEPRLSATWRVHAEPADALLSALVGAPALEELAAAVLDLQRLDARTKLTANQRLLRLDLARGESGALTGQGFWQRPTSGRASGAFLLTTSVANLGLSIDGSEVETDMFAPDDWLDKKRTAKSGRR